MMDEKRLVKVSKYLSKHLRHQPERLGLELEAGGWVRVDDLLNACSRNSFSISLAELEEVVAKNDNQRFSFDETKMKIRANQGHSTEIDLQLEPKIPPQVLYHGTGAQNTDLIFDKGLMKMSRHRVHLSVDKETARKVGMRHGKPVIFEVNTTSMIENGFEFYVSANGVWLVENVPPQFLILTNE